MNFITVAEDEFKKLIAEVEGLFKHGKHPAVAVAAAPVKAAADAAVATVKPVAPSAPNTTA